MAKFQFCSWKIICVLEILLFPSDQLNKTPHLSWAGIQEPVFQTQKVHLYKYFCTLWALRYCHWRPFLFCGIFTVVGRNCHLAPAPGTPVNCLLRSLRVPELPDPVASSVRQVTLWPLPDIPCPLDPLACCVWTAGSVPGLTERASGTMKMIEMWFSPFKKAYSAEETNA